MYALMLLLFAQLNEPLEDKSVIELPTNIVFGFSTSEYEYKVLWVHEGPFCVIGQYNKKELVGGFVLYTDRKPKPYANIYLQSDMRLLKIGTAIYYKRLLHILCLIQTQDVNIIEKIYYSKQKEVLDFYGRF